MNLRELPINWPERKDSLNNQLEDLAKIADQLGFYKAADFLEGNFESDQKEKILRDPVVDKNGKLEEFTVKINNKFFRCSCGCNVFHKPDKEYPDLYECNCCRITYQGS